jgi:hypothetical protein
MRKSYIMPGKEKPPPELHSGGGFINAREESV